MITNGLSFSTYLSAASRWSFLLKSHPVVRSQASPGFTPKFLAPKVTLGGENASTTSTRLNHWITLLIIGKPYSSAGGISTSPYLFVFCAGVFTLTISGVA